MEMDHLLGVMELTMTVAAHLCKYTKNTASFHLQRHVV